jgi:Xaa-Pro aminopeptidase
VYGLVLEAQMRCLKGVRPGATGHELDALCRDYFASKDCADKFQHGTGHGIGLAVHEDPRIKKTVETPVEVGMVFSVEPGLYYEDWGGVRIEDLVAVTPDGHDNLTTTSKELLEVAV